MLESANTDKSLATESRDSGRVEQSRPHDLVALIARALLVGIFLMSGFRHDWQLSNTVLHAPADGVSLPELWVVISIMIEVVAGLMVLTGWNARWAALVLAMYTVTAAFLFHADWIYPPPAHLNALINFWKNVSIAGGFLMVFAFGAGRYSMGLRSSRSATRRN